MRLRARAHSIRAHSIASLAAVALLGAGLALACGREEPAATTSSSPSNAESAQPAAPATTETQREDVQVFEGAVPDGYPSDVPIYPTSEPDGAMAIPGLGMFATFQSDDPVEKILEHFRSGFEENGWTVEASMDDGVDVKKGDRTVEVRVRPRNGRSEIAVNISEGEQS